MNNFQKEEIRFMVERDGSAKGIVFSQFTSFLDLIHYSLQKVKIVLQLLLVFSFLPMRLKASFTYTI